MRAYYIIQTAMEYIQYSVKSTYENKSDVDNDFLNFLLKNKDDNSYNFIVLMMTYLRQNNISAESIIASINEFFHILGLDTIEIEASSNKKIKYVNETFECSSTLENFYEYISELSYMFFEYKSQPPSLNIDQDFFLLCLQNWSHNDYSNYLDLFIKNFRPSLLKLLLKTSWIYTGDNLYGIMKILSFLAKLRNVDHSIDEIINFYIFILNEYNLIIKSSIRLPAVIKNVDSTAISYLSDKFNIYKNLWFAPVLRLHEETFSDMQGKLDLANLKENFLNNKDQAVFSHPLLQYHYFKLLEITISAYDAARRSFYIEKNWLKNKVILKIIEKLENIIDKYLTDKRFIPDQRIFSLKAAKDWIKFNYNIYNKQWKPQEIIEKSIFELVSLIKRKNYYHDSMVIGKVIEVLSKIQDYCNYENIVEKGLEEIYNHLIYEFKTIEHIRSTAERFCYNSENYFELATRFAKYHEMSMSYLSGVKFLNPLLINFEGQENFNVLSMNYVHDYWTYFSKTSKRDLEKVTIIKNSILGQYV